MASSTRVRLQVGTDWVDVTRDTLTSDLITIERGRRNRSAALESSTAKLRLRDQGKYNWQNPRGEYFGRLGPNPPIRIEKASDGYLKLTGASDGNWAETPDHATLDIVGDLDLRADLDVEYGSRPPWASTAEIGVAGKYETAGNQRSWAFSIAANGMLMLYWSPDGTIGNRIFATSTAALPQPAARARIRAVLDVNNGAAGWTVRFYTAATMAGPWTQLGASVSGSGVTSVYAGTAPLTVGDVPAIDMRWSAGRVHAFQLRNGIDGTVVANLDATAVQPGTATIVDSAGRTWTPAAGARFDTGDIRFCGLVQRLPTRWGTSGRARWAEVSARGLIADLEGIDTPVGTPIYREATSETNRASLIAYWPGEDGSQATTLASGIGGPAMQITGDISMASRGDFYGSDPLPELQNDTVLTGQIPTHTVSGAATIAHRGLFAIPAAGLADNARLAEVTQTAGAIRRWVLRYGTGGSMKLQGIDSDGTVLADSGPFGFGLNGQRAMCGFHVVQSGSSVNWAMFARVIRKDLTIVEGGANGTFATATVSRANALIIGATLAGVAVGHQMVGRTTALAAGLDRALVGNIGEPCGRRLERLCREFGITLRTIGDPDKTMPAGPQRSGTQMALLRAAADTDMGALYEARDELALVYRTRRSLYVQSPRLALTYGQVGESPAFDPDPDAADIVNDVTVNSEQGSTARAVRETGRLSVLPPSQGGVGRKPREYRVDVADDSLLPNIASWLLHLGTFGEASYPQITVNVDKLARYGKPALASAATRLDIMERLTISSLPAWMPPWPIDQLAEGMIETIGPRFWTIDFSGSPARAWDVAVYGSSRYGTAKTTAASTLPAAGGTASLTLTFTSPKGWSTTALPYQILVGDAEVMTVTAMGPRVGSGPYTQTATVIRGVNGLTIAHSAGAQVQLYPVPRYAL
ncbi:hypothetical protein [Actinoplanes sp. NPDC048796]|uniref:hypothetical protein n=1 Tax=Actinoplanes sp. NPDC048796 TaxID=3155640 RepID=UPI0033ED028C